MLEKIREFSDNAWEELHDANKYIHLAHKWKECDAHIAEHYMDLAKQEIGHYHILCEMASEILTKCEDEKAKYVWKWMHENLVEKLAELNSKITMFR